MYAVQIWFLKWIVWMMVRYHMGSVRKGGYLVVYREDKFTPNCEPYTISIDNHGKDRISLSTAIFWSTELQAWGTYVDHDQVDPTLWKATKRICDKLFIPQVPPRLLRDLDPLERLAALAIANSASEQANRLSQ